MRAAVLSEVGRPPEPADLPEPEAAEGQVLVEVVAAALNPIDVAVGAGRFYGGHPPLPYVPGSEAVGRVPGEGRLVWAFGGGLGVARDGTMASVAALPADAVVDVPADADPALAAALGIAGLAGWLPLVWRAPVRADDVVLVLGATGTVGLVAVQAARLLGAARVVAAGRDADALERAGERGADALVRVDDDAAATLREACGGDGPTYVLDPLWGKPVAVAVEAAAPGARIVHLGQSAGAEATLPSGTVRGKQLELYGYSNFAVPADVRRREYPRLVGHAMRGDIRLDVERVALEEIGDAWSRQAEGSAHRKLVVVP